MKAKKSNSKNKLLRIITMPIRALGKARDFYVRSIINCSDNITGIGAMNGAPLPRSFSTTSSSSTRSNFIDNNYDDDFVELIRASSSKSLGDNNNNNNNKFSNINHLNLLTMMKSNNNINNIGGSRKVMPRSSSVAMSKIDEDQPYVFGEDDVDVIVTKNEIKFPRSRSYAPTKRNLVL